jgi:hypothetical protein
VGLLGLLLLALVLPTVTTSSGSILGPTTRATRFWTSATVLS